MEQKTEIETERDVLKRIVAMLFTFACLAERASGRSYPVRCLVLWALRRAEAVARDWVLADSADQTHMTAPFTVLHHNSRAEAMYLARCFRALAHALKRQVRLEDRFSRRLLRGKTHCAMAAGTILVPKPTPSGSGSSLGLWASLCAACAAPASGLRRASIHPDVPP